MLAVEKESLLAEYHAIFMGDFQETFLGNPVKVTKISHQMAKSNILHMMLNSLVSFSLQIPNPLGRTSTSDAAMMY